MNFVKPALNQLFTISATPQWPNVPFQTDASGPHTWQWTLEWKSFRKSGTENTSDNAWDAQTVIANCGGTLTVRAEATSVAVSTTVLIKGTNPDGAGVTQYLSANVNSGGFDKIIAHESHFRHFNNQGEPVKSFDNGYGMCQLTNPTPTFDEVWNWKLNVDGGLQLFAQKRASAIAYLSQSGRTYTGDQLTYEAVCRWNGGSYHDWDAAAGKWVRRPTILCDSTTGNIGWDTTDPANAGKTEAELHARDKASYSHPPAPGAHWKYFGVCYADAILG